MPVNRRRRRDIDNFVRRGIVRDEELIQFWQRYFTNREETIVFIKRCLEKTSTRRMMLHVKWYIDVADGMSIVRQGRPALQMIFLFAMAESVSTMKFTRKDADDMGSFKIILAFFRNITTRDKAELETKFRRALINIRNQKLRFSSIIKILWRVRNDAAHGKHFWDFSLMNTSDVDSRDLAYSLMTNGYLGTRRRRQRVSLETRLTYDNLRDIFVRTALNNITKSFS